jgi:hypothetical protein
MKRGRGLVSVPDFVPQPTVPQLVAAASSGTAVLSGPWLAGTLS